MKLRELDQRHKLENQMVYGLGKISQRKHRMVRELRTVGDLLKPWKWAIETTEFWHRSVDLNALLVSSLINELHKIFHVLFSHLS